MTHVIQQMISRRMRALLGIAPLVALAHLHAASPEAKPHWAFQTVAPIRPPEVRDESWLKTPVDQFILAKLEAAKLKPALKATQEQIIRRLSLDLTGLPPTPEEMEAFVKNRTQDSYERLVNRLLASPHYGERWARHWLDLARYAETDGFEHDAVRPHTWRYRDYVIRAFNEDTPYDRFIREQVAGDELWPDQPVALVATGFNLLGPDMVDSADQIQRRINTLNDMTDTTASVFLGLTFGCARCHDHKFEPITQRDYFSMQAFFTPAEFLRDQPVPTSAEHAAHEVAMMEYNSRTQIQRRQIEEIEAPCRQKLFDEKLSKLSEDVQLAHRTPKEHRTMEQEGTVQETAPQVKVTEAEVSKALSQDEKARRAALEGELKKVPKPAAMPLAMVLHHSNGPPTKTFVLARGDYNNPREEVATAFPTVLISEIKNQTSEIEKNPLTPSRAALASWIASEDNPLTARVMVNRIWQHHFGRGLVATPGDFGTRGQPPTHPELIDWLAREFVRGGWSVKRLHKLILLSATYQQSSTTAAETFTRDPENKLFSRQNRVRLEGEVIRDSLLAISGRLNRELGGTSVSPPIAADIATTAKNWIASTNPNDHHRRSVYVFARRNLRFPFLEVFDAPDSNLSCSARGHSTTAPQSLTLLNSAEVMAAAQATAERVIKQAQSNDERIEFAFRLALGRRPGANELVMAHKFLESTQQRQAKVHASNSDANSTSQQTVLASAATDGVWVELCRALFNLNSFVYVD